MLLKSLFHRTNLELESFVIVCSIIKNKKFRHVIILKRILASSVVSSNQSSSTSGHSAHSNTGSTSRRMWAGWWRTWVQDPCSGSYIHSDQPIFEVNTMSYPLSTWDFQVKLKLSKQEPDHQHRYNLEVEVRYSSTSTPTYTNVLPRGVVFKSSRLLINSNTLLL